MSWVTWAFVGLAALVALVAAAISGGRLDVSFERPYEPGAESGDPRRGRSGIEWSEPVAGRSDDRLGQHPPENNRGDRPWPP